MTNWEELAARCKGRWMMGGSAVAETVGTTIAPLHGEESGAELKLLAAIGQSLQICFEPSATDKLVCKPELPALKLQVMPEESRHHFRRSIAQANAVTGERETLVFLAAGRNYAVHPSDWFPHSSTMRLPDIYNPWLDWLDQDTDKDSEAQGELSDETWDEFYPATRCHLLQEMRRVDPQKALTLIIENAASEPAEKRLKIIAVLEEGLNDSDIEYLESLDKDRSGKIRVLSNQLLMRLGARRGSKEELKELLDFLTVKQGGTLKRNSLTARPVKTNAQKNRRSELFQKISVNELLTALEWSEEQLVAAWSPPVKDIRATDDFCAMVAFTGSGKSATALATRFADQSACSTDALVSLCERLSDNERASVAAECLKVRSVGKNESVLSRALACAGNALGLLSIDQIKKNSEYKDLIALAKVSAGTNEKKANAANLRISHYLPSIGLLANQFAAQEILSSLKKAGIPEFDPRLNDLRFNASLPKTI